MHLFFFPLHFWLILVIEIMIYHEKDFFCRKALIITYSGLVCLPLHCQKIVYLENMSKFQDLFLQNLYKFSNSSEHASNLEKDIFIHLVVC